MERTVPPSPRRRTLARRAGLHAASPVLVGAVACAGALLAIYATGRAAIDRLGSAIRAAATGEGAVLGPGDAIVAVLALVAPVIGAAAIGAVVAHLAQTRAPFLPRRRLDDAPAPEPHRVRRAAFELGSAGVIGGVAVGWLWLVAPKLAALPSVPLAGAALALSALGAFAIAWVALGVLDALLRHNELAHALMMTQREQREDARLAAADPRWRRLRTKLAAPTTRDALATATLLLLGDDVAVAIAWDPHRQPTPVRTAIGQRARATQLLGLARRFRIPVHRDAALAGALASGDGAVPEEHWPRLAEIVAAVRPSAQPLAGEVV